MYKCMKVFVSECVCVFFGEALFDFLLLPWGAACKVCVIYVLLQHFSSFFCIHLSLFLSCSLLPPLPHILQNAGLTQPLSLSIDLSLSLSLSHSLPPLYAIRGLYLISLSLSV